MGEKREIVSRYVSMGLRVIDAVSIVGIKKSAYYYRPNGRPKGKGVSTRTLRVSGEWIPDTDIVIEITKLLSPEYHDYGYKVVSVLIKRKGFIINHKKVRRIMKENHLLHPLVRKAKGWGKEFVKEPVPALVGPFITVEVDIKYVYIHQENRNGYLISFLCTFCRSVPVWSLQYSMPGSKVAGLVSEFVNHPEVQEYIDIKKIKVIIRTDNGPQFIAKVLADAIQKAGLQHEFIQPGTPEQNGHIESFHSTETRLVCQRNIFMSLKHAQSIFTDFFEAYNKTRVMSELLYFSPEQFLKLWKSNVIGIKRNKKKQRNIFLQREAKSVFGNWLLS